MTPKPPDSRIAVYPGSFDFLTNGHVDLIRRCQSLFDRLIVAIGVNTAKEPFFSVEERLEILREVTAPWPNVEVTSFNGLTVEFAAARQAKVIVRGLRAVSDFEFELQLSLINHQLNPDIETVFVAADPKNIFLSSSMIKDMWRHGGPVEEFVPPAVARALSQRRPDLA